ncbi:MAG: hypothetical protein OHK0052_17860 [Anaerolineales bacterium]
MTESVLTAWLLTAVANYGAPVVGLTLLCGALGLPVPGSLMVIAAGAFIRQELLALPQTLLWAAVGTLLGDSLSYGMGRFGGVWLLRRFGESAVWQRASGEFARRGGVSIFLTRFLLTPLAIPVNWIAGMSRYGFLRFLRFDAAGELMWFGLYGGMGYVVGSQWETLSALVQDFGGFVAGAALLGIAAGLWVQQNRRKRHDAVSAAKISEGDASPTDAAV